mmetsp:Transcript_76795/g.120951  ORF Transcript_76795/g.120951 Transcript_76795/m.120951 type:complete len:279 (-) Transcript_76795:153-989(-)
MLELQLTVAPELLLVLESHHAKGIPVAQRRAGTKLLRRIELGEEALAIVEGRDVSRSELFNRRLSCEAILDQHSSHGDHGQTPVVQLGGQLQLALGRVLDLPAPVASAEVARLPILAVSKAAQGRILEELGLNEAGHQQDLQPSLQRHLGNGGQAAGHVGELQVLRWGQVAIELAEDVGPQHADGGEHANSSMLQLHGPAAIKILLGAVTSAVADRIPEQQRVACADLLGGVVGIEHHLCLCLRHWAAQRHGSQTADAEPSHTESQAAVGSTAGTTKA